MSKVMDDRAETSGDQGVYARLDVPPDSRYLALARTFGRDVAVCAGVAGNGAEDVKLAISELTTNAVKAHRVAGVDKPICIEADRSGSAIRITVSDRGHGFTEGSEAAAGVDATGGFGLAVVRALFPDLIIDHVPGRGTDVSFVIHGD